MWNDRHESDKTARPFALASITAAVSIIALILAWSHAPVAYAAELTAAHPSAVIGADQAAEETTWSDFRGSPTNNAVTDAATPRTADEAGLVWALKLDGGYMSPCILVDDALVLTCGGSPNGFIYKLNKDTGAVLARGMMSGSSTFSLIPPTYADGKIFVTLSGGGMQAFDADSLEPLWVHRDELGGQGNCMIAYSDGCVYTGYWGGETAEASFVCLDAQTGELLWKKQNTGGYYWVGAVAVGDYLVFGCDDGKASETGTSQVRCVEKATGREVSSITVSGDQRSSISYEPSLGRLYFTTKPGLLYSVEIDAQTGVLSNCKSLKVDAECVSTPLVYDGRVYVGASGGGFAKGSMSVVDASSLAMLYQLDSSSGITASVKSAPLVTTAYRDDEADGKLYLYFTCNFPPGSVTVLEVEPSSTSANQAKVFELFKPPEAMQQYCISSVICDASGHLYYRNDSNYLMCIGPEGMPPEDYVVPSDPKPSPDPEPSPSPEPSPPNPSSGDDPAQQNNAVDPGSGSTGGTESQESTGGSEASQQSKSGGTVTTTSAAGTGKASTTAASNSGGSAATTGNASGAALGGSGGTGVSESKRHTDAEAATQRLDAAGLQETKKEGLAPAAVILGCALAALLALVIIRVVSSRKRSPASIGADASGPDSAGEDGSAHAR